MKHAIEGLFSSSEAQTVFCQPIAEQIWRNKYQYRRNDLVVDRSAEDTWHRVSNALAASETPDARARVAAKFFDAMSQFKLLPAGRILAGCGTERDVTLSNTFVMQTLPDSVAGIMDTVKQAALTMKMGGGLGFDFSTIRPKGATVRGLDCPAAGPLAVMDICDAVCKMVVTGMGRGAMMATMRCDHPDIEAFVTAKQERGRFNNFNTSVMVTDAFMRAVRDDAPWDLIWEGETFKRISARELWHTIMRQTYAAAEPGVLFIDRINDLNPLGYLERISATNSCAEQPLPPNGTCPLASINLARLVHQPFTCEACLDLDELRDLAETAVRLLDNALDVSRFANAEQEREALGKRRIGVGVTGVGDALIMLGVRYGSLQAQDLIAEWMRCIQNAGYLASARLAAERGAFPLYDADQHMTRAGIWALDDAVRQRIAAYGLRNGTITTIAPTGTISMYAGNVSSGIEPVFATAYKRKITMPDGTKAEEQVEDYAVWLYHQIHGRGAPLTPAFVTAQDLSPADHVAMQAAAQKWVDSGISKTVNCPEDLPFDAFEGVYLSAYEKGCKGCTTYRPNDILGSVLST